jgi:hypothetical protein
MCRKSSGMGSPLALNLMESRVWFSVSSSLYVTIITRHLAAGVPSLRQHLVDALVAEGVASDQPPVGSDEPLVHNVVRQLERRTLHEVTLRRLAGEHHLRLPLRVAIAPLGPEVLYAQFADLLEGAVFDAP